MPEHSDDRKPFRRNSSGSDNGFRRSAGGDGKPGSGGEKPADGRSRGAAGRGGFRRDDAGTGGQRGDRSGESRAGNRGRAGTGDSRFGGDSGRGAYRGDRDRTERGGPATGRDNRGGRPDDRSGFRAGGSRPDRDDKRSGGYGSSRDTRPGADKPERGYQDRGDHRGGNRPVGEGTGRDRSYRDATDRPDRRPDSGERRFGQRGGPNRPGRGADRTSGPVGNNGPGEYRRTGDSGGPRRRGGEGAARGADRRPPRPDEPDLPDDIQAGDLDPAIRRDLLSLDKGNAETVARHLVMAAQLLDDEPRLALAHAQAARQRAGRIAVVRETAGVVAYHAGEWAEALSELRAARRMAGGSGLLAVMADCERGLGRPERAIEIGRSDEGRALTGDEAIELRIVVAGARMDLGQYDQAVVTLQTPDLDPARTGSGPARLFYAYADALVAAGRTEEGLTWFFNAASADLDGETDAEERAAELTGGS
ncbi:hypothetical protein [Nocardia sp. NPDC051750]|uniref:hypothetical protein n=1 Tax=Nocardia sp. NPDC051750 TaxID=3364325 RepID=UPI0037964865